MIFKISNNCKNDQKPLFANTASEQWLIVATGGDIWNVTYIFKLFLKYQNKIQYFWYNTLNCCCTYDNEILHRERKTSVSQVLPY